MRVVREDEYQNARSNGQHSTLDWKKLSEEQPPLESGASTRTELNPGGEGDVAVKLKCLTDGSEGPNGAVRFWPVTGGAMEERGITLPKLSISCGNREKLDNERYRLVFHAVTILFLDGQSSPYGDTVEVENVRNCVSNSFRLAQSSDSDTVPRTCTDAYISEVSKKAVRSPNASGCVSCAKEALQQFSQTGFAVMLVCGSILITKFARTRHNQLSIFRR
jgi:hypothetical protein